MRITHEQKKVTKKRAYLNSELKKMEDDKTLSEMSRKHWEHKPYINDFGGAKDETLR